VIEVNPKRNFANTNNSCFLASKLVGEVVKKSSYERCFASGKGFRPSVKIRKTGNKEVIVNLMKACFREHTQER
jgi:hypothetical protein